MPVNTVEHKEPAPAPPHSLWGPLRGLGLWRVLGHMWQEMGRTNLSLMASALAFYGLLATFPALVVVITSFALLTDPIYIERLLNGLQGIVPEEAWTLLAAELKSLGAAPDRQAGLSLILGLAISLWSAHSASASVMEALNRIYRVDEGRGVLAYHGIAFAFTLGGLCFGLAALAVVAVIPVVLAWLTLSAALDQLLSFIRWPVLAAFMMGAFVVLYRYAPYRQHPLWSRILIGAGMATFLWLVGSALFSIYVARFGSYDKTYGSIGAVIVLLMWFYVSAFTTLLGALLDAEMSHRVRLRHEPPN